MMQILWGIAAGVAMAFLVLEWACRRLPFRALNYRGHLLTVCLGTVEVAATAAGILLAFTGVLVGTGDVDISALLVLAAIAAVYLAGLYDDSRLARTRGLLSHLRLLARGTVTSGVVKLLVIVGAALLVALVDESRGVRLFLAIPFIAGSANLWNLLDVAPGRALKYFVVAASALAVAGYRYVLLPVALGAGLVLLPFDVRERAMLGDSGSNVLGFIIGIVAFETLTVGGLAVGLAVILVLHWLAETVTLSRIIESTPPLRWFDRLGRLPPDQAKPESSSNPKDSTAT